MDGEPERHGQKKLEKKKESGLEKGGKRHRAKLQKKQVEQSSENRCVLVLIF